MFRLWRPAPPSNVPSDRCNLIHKKSKDDSSMAVREARLSIATKIHHGYRALSLFNLQILLFMSSALGKRPSFFSFGIKRSMCASSWLHKRRWVNMNTWPRFVSIMILGPNKRYAWRGTSRARSQIRAAAATITRAFERLSLWCAI